MQSALQQGAAACRLYNCRVNTWQTLSEKDRHKQVELALVSLTIMTNPVGKMPFLSLLCASLPVALKLEASH